MARSGFRQREEPEPTDEDRPTYKDAPTDELSNYLQTHFIAPAMHALEDGDSEAATRIAEAFARFCGTRGPLTDDAYALAAVVRSPSTDQTTALLSKYFEKILAVAGERFEEAIFAANIWAIVQNTAPDVYLDPEPFFNKTYMTVGLGTILSRVAITPTGSTHLGCVPGRCRPVPA